MSEISFRVVFDGSITEEYDLASTKKRFSRFFKLSAKKTESLFSGSEHVLKANLTEEDAMKYALAIANIGCECIIEEMPFDDDLSNQPGFVERRFNSERRITKSRRKIVRGSAIRPDRRENNGRRRTDKN